MVIDLDAINSNCNNLKKFCLENNSYFDEVINSISDFEKSNRIDGVTWKRVKSFMFTYVSLCYGFKRFNDAFTQANNNLMHQFSPLWEYSPIDTSKRVYLEQLYENYITFSKNATKTETRTDQDTGEEIVEDVADEIARSNYSKLASDTKKLLDAIDLAEKIDSPSNLNSIYGDSKNILDKIIECMTELKDIRFNKYDYDIDSLQHFKDLISNSGELISTFSVSGSTDINVINALKYSFEYCSPNGSTNSFDNQVKYPNDGDIYSYNDARYSNESSNKSSNKRSDLDEAKEEQNMRRNNQNENSSSTTFSHNDLSVSQKVDGVINGYISAKNAVNGIGAVELNKNVVNSNNGTKIEGFYYYDENGKLIKTNQGSLSEFMENNNIKDPSKIGILIGNSDQENGAHQAYVTIDDFPNNSTNTSSTTENNTDNRTSSYTKRSDLDEARMEQNEKREYQSNNKNVVENNNNNNSSDSSYTKRSDLDEARMEQNEKRKYQSNNKNVVENNNNSSASTYTKRTDLDEARMEQNEKREYQNVEKDIDLRENVYNGQQSVSLDNLDGFVLSDSSDLYDDVVGYSCNVDDPITISYNNNIELATVKDFVYNDFNTSNLDENGMNIYSSNGRFNDIQSYAEFLDQQLGNNLNKDCVSLLVQYDDGGMGFVPINEIKFKD